MLKKNFRNYIEEAVRDQYQKIDKKQNSIITLREKINNFDRFLEVYSNEPKYKNEINKFYSELEKMVCDEEKISFKQFDILDTIIEIIAQIKNIKLNNSNNYEALKALNIITNNEIYENLKLNLKNPEEIEKYLESIGRIDLIPIIKTYYICSNIENVDNIKIYWDYVSNIFIGYLELVNKIKEYLIEQYIPLKLNIKGYIKEIIKNYENKINFKYIPSSVIKVDTYDFLETAEEDGEETQTLRFIDINNNEKYKKIKLIGYAGVGKTTTLEYIEYQDALNYDENKKIPVIINLITVNELIPIEKLICRKLKIEEDNEEVIKYLIRKNKINIYLDGINEINIQDINTRKEFINSIEDFINKKENNELKVIVTDRDNDEISVLNNSYTFLIQGMNENDIEEFIQGNAQSDKVEEIKKIITKNEGILESVTHPIMLKNIITIIECGKAIPQNIEELATVYLDSIIERELKEKKDNYASYVKDFLRYLVKKIVEEQDCVANPPISHFQIIPTFYEYADKNNIKEFDATRLLDLLIKMGILKEIEFQKYAFSDERFFQKFYNDIIEEID